MGNCRGLHPGKTEIMQAYREFKTIWDPDWKMNPGKVIDAYPITSNLRIGSDYNPREPKTHFQFPEDHGSFARAALRVASALLTAILPTRNRRR